MTDPSGAAVFYALASAIVVVFQIGLAIGMPWGAYAMGGAYPGRFPPKLRVAAAIQAVVLGALAVVVLSDAGLMSPALAETWPWLVWGAVVVSAISVVLNAITRSPVERRIWLPVAVVLFATSGVVAIT